MALGYKILALLLVLFFLVLTTYGNFAINGASPNINSGRSVTIGDVNGDGFGDVIIGAESASANGKTACGQTYILFGRNGIALTQFNLTSLNGTNGFFINGISSGDNSGFSVASGDVNGDQVDDIIIGAPKAIANGIILSGQTYVVFGINRSFPSQVDLSYLDGSNGFVVNGIAVGDSSGYSVGSGGDVNGDSIDDIIISAKDASAYDISGSGQIYIIFGKKTGFNAQFNLSALDGSNGFTIHGGIASGYVGWSVSIRGDINADNIDDILIGAPFIDTNGLTDSGQSYLIFGKKVFPSNFNLTSVNGSNGFTINGALGGGRFGQAVSLGGDVNGDGFDDILIGAYYGSTKNGNASGQSYVIFGKNTSYPSMFDLNSLNGENGFLINGVSVQDRSGSSVSLGHDVNGDKIDDILIGAHNADSKTKSFTGQTYVIFSSKSFPSVFELATLNGSNGFTINGINSNDFSGSAVALGDDINGDKIGDIVIGAPFAHPYGATSSGQTYVLFGTNSSEVLGSFNLSELMRINRTILTNKIFKVETQQRFSFNFSRGLFSEIGRNFTASSSLKSLVPLPSWMNFSGDTLTFTGIPDQPGTHQIIVVATNENGTITANFVLNVQVYQRNFILSTEDTKPFAYEIPDPSGGLYTFQVISTHLPSFIKFNTTGLVLSCSAPNTIAPQMVNVTIIGGDGSEQVRYEYSFLFAAAESSSIVISEESSAGNGRHSFINSLNDYLSRY